MNSIRKALFGLGLFALPVVLYSQLSSTETVSTTGTAVPDSVVQLAAEAQGLTLVPAADLPENGTFWNVTANGIMAPWPCPPPNAANLAIYAINPEGGQFLVDSTDGKVNINGATSVQDALAALADSVTSFISQIQELQAARSLARAVGMEAEPDSSPDFSPLFESFDTNSVLYLQITKAADGVAHLNLMNATNYVYEIFSKEDLAAANWDIAGEVFPTDAACLPFTVPQLGRTNLFVWARDWTGITSNGNQTPEWWFWKYFGTVALSDTNLDSNGNTLLSDYQNGIAPPNVISFTVRLGNQHFNTANAGGTFLVLAGHPSYEAVLVDDTNLNDAVSQPYDGNITLNLGPTDGGHQVWLSLKGFAPDTQPTWVGTTVYLDRVAPVITITSPTNDTTAVPYLQLQGYSLESLRSVTYDLSNAAGLVTNQLGQLLGGQFFDINQWAYTTDYFQCFDVPLTNGLNTITVYATDLAGNVTATNLNYTLDYSSATNPVIKLYWPQGNTAVIGASFTWRGWVDDPAATVMAQIVDTNNATNIVQGMVERDGKFWTKNLPLSGGTNRLTLWVTNAAGLSSATNLVVVQSSLNLTINPVSDDLWLPGVGVSGTLDDTNYTVWVNGVKSVNNGNGTWSAANVPLPPGGAAVIQARAIPNSNNGGNGTGGGGPVSYDNLGNPDPPQDNDRETGELDRPTEVVLESDTRNYAQMMDAGTLHWTGTLSWTADGGGSSHDSFYPGDDWDINDDTIGPDGNISLDHYTSSDGTDTIFTNLGAADLPWSIGSLAGVSYLPTGSGSLLWSSFDESVRAKVVLHTGGRRSGGRQGLFQLTASATEELATPPYSRSIPSQQISVAGQALGGDGVAWLVFPDGITVDVTPQTGAPYYDYNVTAQKYSPVITANGTQLDPDTVVDGATNFWVGQLLAFGVSGLPGYVDSVQHWTLPGNYVNESYAYSPVCTSYRKNSGLLTSLSTSCWYVDKINPGTASIDMNLHFANGQHVSISPEGKFNVSKPQVSWVGYPYSSVAVDTGYDGSGATYLHFGTTHSPDFGVYLTKQIIDDGGFSGTFTPTQLRDVSELACGTNGLSLHRTGVGLDVGADGLGLSTHPDDSNTYWDSPAIDCDDSNYHVSVNYDKFRTFLMFQPTGGISVPLKLIEWNWFGSADKTGGWHKASGIGDVTTSDQDTTEFPVWTNVVNGQDGTGFTDSIDNNCQ